MLTTTPLEAVLKRCNMHQQSIVEICRSFAEITMANDNDMYALEETHMEPENHRGSRGSSSSGLVHFQVPCGSLPACMI